MWHTLNSYLSEFNDGAQHACAAVMWL